MHKPVTRSTNQKMAKHNDDLDKESLGEESENPVAPSIEKHKKKNGSDNKSECDFDEGGNVSNEEERAMRELEDEY